MSTAALPQSQSVPDGYRLRATAAIACFLALATLTISARGILAPPVLAMIIVASAFSNFRLVTRPQVMTVRVILMAVVIAVIATSERSRTAGHWLINTDYSLAFGQLCAAELAVQCWRKVPSGGMRGYSIILLSGLVFISGCNTTEYRFVRWIAPAYMLMVALTLRDYRYQTGPTRRFSKLSLSGLIAALMIGGGIYYVFYTYQHQITMLFLRALRERVHENVGLSDEPELGPTSNLRGSGLRVLRIDGRFEGGHLRCMAYDKYAFGKWTPTLGNRKFENMPGPSLNQGVPGPRITVTRLADDNRWIVAPLNVVGIVASGGRVIEYAPRDGGPMRTTIWPPPPYPYDLILSSEPHFQGPLCLPVDLNRLESCGIVSTELEAPVKQLAQKIAGHLNDPLEKVRAVERYLQDNYQYSLTQDPGKGDPISSFLLRTKKGHCEFFASAAVMLLRCVDVPTRYVTGFHAHEWNGVNKMTVRDSDAHAWAESYITGVGWVTVEATPPSGMPAMQPVAWYIRAWEAIKDAFMAAWEWVLDQGWAIILWVAGAGLTVYAAFKLIQFLITLKKRSVTELRINYSSPNPALQTLAQRFEKFLKKSGAPCPANTPWNEHLDSLRKPTSDARAKSTLDLQLAESFLMQYNSVRFGNPNDDGAVAQLRELLAKMEQ